MKCKRCRSHFDGIAGTLVLEENKVFQIERQATMWLKDLFHIAKKKLTDIIKISVSIHKKHKCGLQPSKGRSVAVQAVAHWRKSPSGLRVPQGLSLRPNESNWELKFFTDMINSNFHLAMENKSRNTHLWRFPYKGNALQCTIEVLHRWHLPS